MTTPNGKTTLFGKYYTQCGRTQRLSVLCLPEIAAQSFTVFLQKNAVKNLSHFNIPLLLQGGRYEKFLFNHKLFGDISYIPLYGSRVESHIYLGTGRVVYTAFELTNCRQIISVDQH